ncbi:hypothetical protein J22TS1_22430 [Siminovitchia terrae]|uniref:hypothetical protein n=1 Tax=Siminovitchia terrae TaxID=1914933 RepID=UPI00163C74A9|nr:hypothetical protein [Siminovitchia terrae]GIN91192.1 hypothetical protein J22TS1_22430 [Siminovitchia terrae]
MFLFVLFLILIGIYVINRTGGLPRTIKTFLMVFAIMALIYTAAAIADILPNPFKY